MKLLTHSFLTCAVKSCRSIPASYPLHFKDCSLEQSTLDFQPLFVRNILPRVNWEALQTSCAELGLAALLPARNPVDTLALVEDGEGLEEAEMKDTGADADAGENTTVKDEQQAEQEEVLRKMHTLLLETSIVEGKLVCGNCGFEYPIKEGVGNFLLPPHLV